MITATACPQVSRCCTAPPNAAAPSRCGSCEDNTRFECGEHGATCPAPDCEPVAAEESYCIGRVLMPWRGPGIQTCGSLSAQRHGVYLSLCEDHLAHYLSLNGKCHHEYTHETEPVCLDCGSPLCEGCWGEGEIERPGLNVLQAARPGAYDCPTCGGKGVKA